MHKPYLFAEILGQKSWVQLIHKIFAFRGSKLACEGQKLTENLQLKLVVDHCFSLSSFSSFF